MALSHVTIDPSYLKRPVLDRRRGDFLCTTTFAYLTANRIERNGLSCVIVQGKSYTFFDRRHRIPIHPMPPKTKKIVDTSVSSSRMTRSKSANLTMGSEPPRARHEYSPTGTRTRATGTRGKKTPTRIRTGMGARVYPHTSTCTCEYTGTCKYLQRTGICRYLRVLTGSLQEDTVSWYSFFFLHVFHANSHFIADSTDCILVVV